MPITLNGDTGITTPSYGGTNAAEYLVPVTAFKNRIINGAMQIDQRNAGASVTASASGSYYAVDRTLFFKDSAAAFTLQQSSVAPSGFNKSLLVTVTTASSSGAANGVIFQHNIEGLNTGDLSFGTATPSTISVSFWVRSSLTGTYCVALRNSAFNRSYVAEYSISSANTWEYKTVTIVGDTTGTWLTDNGAGIRVGFDLGGGSNANATVNTWTASAATRTTSQANFANTSGATFYITGVQLEKGSTATSFDYRPYGTELALCQRYCVVITNALSASSRLFGFNISSSNNLARANFQVATRVPPTGVIVTGAANTFEIFQNNATVAPSSISFDIGDIYGANLSSSASLAANAGAMLALKAAGNKIEFTGMEL